jgi:hypothetical protein
LWEPKTSFKIARNTESIMSLDEQMTVSPEPNAATTLQHLARESLRAVTESLGWRRPRDQIARERTSTSYFATAVHQYSTSTATLTVFVTSEPGRPFDIRVTCEFGDSELVNAERIVHEAGVDDDEVREWLAQQLNRCTTAITSRTRGR